MKLLPPFVGSPEVNRVYNCDALTLLAALPTGSVDAVITDPPYNTTELAFEQVIDWREFWLQVRRILKTPNSPTVVFSQQPFTTDLIMSNRKSWRYELIWEKSLAMGFLDSNRKPLRAHENIEVFSDAQANYWPQMEESSAIRAIARRRDNQTDHYSDHKGSTYIDNGTRYPRSVWKFSARDTAFSNTVSLHPTAKPLPLMERLIATYTEPNALIVDPFCGSGSTAVAAQRSNRRFIVGDTDAGYCEIARKRLSQPYTPMFAELTA